MISLKNESFIINIPQVSVCFISAKMTEPPSRFGLSDLAHSTPVDLAIELLILKTKIFANLLFTFSNLFWQILLHSSVVNFVKLQNKLNLVWSIIPHMYLKYWNFKFTKLVNSPAAAAAAAAGAGIELAVDQLPTGGDVMTGGE